ncbi:MAG TPA: tetratricopeptide repeat protein [Blastocatellia bacterium]|nr:tetratricopeptide repeat protein [Blastocatellia bacterium]
MQRAADGHILTNLSSLKQFPEAEARPAHTSFFQHLCAQLISGVNAKRLYIDLGDKLVALAEQAYGVRQLDKLEDLSQALLALPLPGQYASAARYFRALELIRRGELDAAKSVLEGVASEPQHKYTARAIHSLGVTFHSRGDFESALKLYVEAGCRAGQKGSFDSLTALFTQRNIAVLKSGNGDHGGALSDLERMVPLTKAVGSIHPPVYYDYLNSLAVELGEMGRLEEAAYASRIVVSSPFAIAYPEWRQTFDEIASKQEQRATRPAVAVRQNVGSTPTVEEYVREPGNLLRLPTIQRPTIAARVDQPWQGSQARVLNFQHWKTMVNRSSRPLPQEVTAEQRSWMTTGEKLIRLMDLISQDETDDEMIDRILAAVEQIVPKRRGEKLD